MENFSYHVPFYVVTGGIDLAGHSSELSAGQVGLFDRSTFSVATGAGNGKEFFFAQGNIGGKDWYGQPVTGSHKSAYFFGKDVENIYLSKPQTVQNEQWVIGFNGSTSSKGITYQVGVPVRIKMFFHGGPIYRFFGGPKEYVVSYTPPENCSDPCSGPDCPPAITDCLAHTQKLVNEINNHTELQKFGVRAQLVNTPYTAGTPNMTKYCLSLCDNGDVAALHAVQAQAPENVFVTRTARVGSISTYQFCQLTTAAAPAAFVQSGSVLEAVCLVCPTGSTLVASTDVYVVRRPLLPTTDLTTDAARDTYADSVGTDYASNDAGSTFLGNNDGQGVVQIKVAPGTVVTAVNSDTVEFSHTEAANCTFAAGTAVPWTTCGTGISSSRTLRINALNRPDCNLAGDRLADLTEVLAGVRGIQIGTLTKIAGVACVDDYTVQQNSDDCLDEDCLSNNVSFTYDDVPSFEGKAWEVVPPVVVDDPNRKCGIRISAGYIDPKFGNCSFDPFDFYETQPLKMEVSLLMEDASNCDVATWPSVHQAQEGRIARQSGEYVVREVIMKTDAYIRHIRQYDADPRMRDAFDQNLLNSVDRNAFYNLYYVTFSASYGAYTFRKNEQEVFTAVFAFKETDATSKVFEANVLSVLTAKSGVAMHVNE